MKTRYWPAALALLSMSGGALAADKAACPPGLVCASAPTTVGAAIMKAGYQGLIGKDSLGDPKIESAAAGYKFAVFFYGCEKNAACDSLQFYASFDPDETRGAEFVNRWNAQKRFTQMSMRDDHRIELRYDVSTVGGLNAANFADVID